MLNPIDPSLKTIIRWLLVCLLFPLVFLNGWLLVKVLQFLQPLVTVFALAVLFTFILGYPVRFLQRKGLKRTYAVLLVFATALLIVASVGITLVPTIVADVREIAQQLPAWIEKGSQQLQILEQWAIDRGLPVSLSQIIDRVSDSFSGDAQSVGNEAVTLAVDAIDWVSEALIVTVLTFYFLLDEERVTDVLFRRIPGKFASKLERSFQQNFQNYFIGQATLAVVLGCVMSITFLLLQVPYALLLGLGVAVLSFIPFADSLSYGVIGLVLGIQDIWLGVRVFAIALIVDQIIDQLVAPRLLGRFTGLKPVWVLVALLLGTKIGGLLGLIVAVPIATVIKDVLDGFPSISDGENKAGEAIASDNAEGNAAESGVTTDLVTTEL